MLRARSGIAALEFGLLAPLFLLLLAGVVDFVNAYVAKSLLDATVSSAANYALLNNTTWDNATLAAKLSQIISTSNSNDHWFNGVVVVNNGATSTVTSGVSSASGTANPSSCYCPTGTASSLVWGTAVACGNTCTDGGLAGTFISISATYTYVPIFSGYNFLPNGTMTSAVVLQTS